MMNIISRDSNVVIARNESEKTVISFDCIGKDGYSYSETIAVFDSPMNFPKEYDEDDYIEFFENLALAIDSKDCIINETDSQVFIHFAKYYNKYNISKVIAHMVEMIRVLDGVMCEYYNDYDVIDSLATLNDYLKDAVALLLEELND